MVRGLKDMTSAISATDCPSRAPGTLEFLFAQHVERIALAVDLLYAICWAIAGSRKVLPWCTCRIACIKASAALRLVR